MKEPIRAKLQQIAEHKNHLQLQLSDQKIVQDMDKFQKLSKELHQLLPIADAYERYCHVSDELTAAESMANDQTLDQEMQ